MLARATTNVLHKVSTFLRDLPSKRQKTMEIYGRVIVAADQHNLLIILGQ